MSLLPILPVNAAIDITTVEVDGANIAVTTVYYGDTIVIIGDGVTAGKNVRVYWDAVDTWDGAAGLLNSTKASANGTFELWFDVPEALVGDHYIWLEDANTGETLMYAYPTDVGSFVDVTPSAGLEGDTITLKGYGYGEEVDIVTIQITGTLGGPAIDHEDLTTSPVTPETSELGSWTATFKVPKIADGYVYDDYTIECTDDDANVNIEADSELKIGPAVSLNIEEGPAGTVVRASGRGFEDDGDVVAIRIINDGGGALDGDWETVVEVDADDLEISGNGLFTVDIVIPAVKEAADHIIEFEDNVGNIGEADFEVLGLPEVTCDPSYGVQGSSVGIEGWNFTQIAGEDVEVYVCLVGDDPIVDGTKVETLETDKDGYFSGTFKIPGLASDTYEVWALQEDWKVNNTVQAVGADANFKIGLMIVILSPDVGPSGALVSLTASGFEIGGEWQAWIGDEVIEDNGAVDGAGAINEEFWIPSMEPGIYTVKVWDVDTDINVTSEFEVTDKTMVETSPIIAPNEFNVTIEGWFFAEAPTDPTLEFVLWNETDDWEITVYSGEDPVAGAPITADVTELELAPWDWDDGYFRGWFYVPDSDALSFGTYTLNVTDGEGLFAQYELEIVDKTVDIESRKSVFRIDETVSFNVESSFIQDESYIKIWAPDGSLYWKTDGFAQADWVEVGTLQRYPYFAQTAGGNLMTLLDDTPLGTYSWAWYDVDDDELDDGTFTVEAAEADVIGEQVADLNNQITELADQLSDVSAEFDDVKSDIADVAVIAEQAVTAAQQAAEAVQTVAQTANTASQAASDAAEAANAARDAANGLTTLVYGAIGAALVAALAAIVSLMQISRRIAG